MTQNFKFQYLYGAVKRRASFKNGSELLDFNTYMVQLKEITEVTGGQWGSIFQYLYGAVKSKISLRETCSYNCISIPIWCS
ncbi:Uncharacterised protein [Myroides odoratimimus]|uniref:Bacteriocin-type signal sequence n=1 Tax=Myroides odoratimimus CCUG 10230 TaxID=883150 RepID=A0ABN0EB95_9FLAO|nr:hypothetical protein HMPREF9712_01574 [Myroides odoratimimus CCUG 10230]STZ49154.1 Uncharacterised protein [Myroides odoratimimus]